ncbi:MAG: alpha/beta hydrolase [Deltaproteobacteria bacterium]|nr:alpha/beta hydrolase [Deltaproteobacteria bacterium]
MRGKMHGMTPRTRSIVLTLLIVAMVLLPACRAKEGPSDMVWDAYVRDHRVDADFGDYTMHYIDMGTGRPVFMVHGFADSTYTWHNNVKTFVDAGYRVIAVDLPGLGQSSVPDRTWTASIENLSDSVLLLADRLKIDKFAVVGNSMGGGISLYLAWTHPARVVAAVPISPASFPQKAPGITKLVKIPVLGDINAQFMGAWTARSALKQVFYDENLVTDTLIDEYSRPFTKPNYKDYLARLLRRYFSDQFVRMSESYPEVQVPVLALWGEQDRWVPVEFGERLDEQIPDSRLIRYPNCGHLAQQEVPEKVNKDVMAFFEKVGYGPKS